MRKMIYIIVILLGLFSCHTYKASDINNKKFMCYNIFRGEIEFHNDSLFSYKYDLKISEGKWKIENGKYIKLKSFPISETKYYAKYPKELHNCYLKFNKQVKIKNRKTLLFDDKIFILKR